MPVHSDFDLNKPFFDPANQETIIPRPTQKGRQWSYTTLKAARPTPDKFQRSYAVDWNRHLPEGHELRVNPAEFPLETPERSPEEIEANWERLRELSRNAPKLKGLDPWQ